MIRKINRVIQDFLRPKRLALGKVIYDKKKKLNEKEFNIKNVKSILFVRNDGKIGDMVVTSFLFREIKKNYPNIKISLVVSGGAYDIVSKNPHIDNIYIYNRKDREIFKKIKDIDLLIDLSENLKVHQMRFISKIGARYNLGMNKSTWKMFNLNFEYSKRDKHITHRYVEVLNYLGIDKVNPSYDIYMDKKIEEEVDEFFQKYTENIVVINPYGASKYRTLNEKTITFIVEEICKNSSNIVTFVYPPNKKNEIKKVIENLSENLMKKIVFYENIKNIYTSQGIIKRGNLLITPDTSIVHIGVAYGKKTLAFYREDRKGDNNFTLWGPNSKEVDVVFSKRNTEIGSESDINDIDLKEVSKRLELLLLGSKKI